MDTSVLGCLGFFSEGEITTCRHDLASVLCVFYSMFLLLMTVKEKAHKNM